MTDRADIRVMGTPEVVTATIERLGTVLDVSYDGNVRPNRHGDGVRAHLNAGLPTAAPAEPADDPADDPSPRAAAEDAKARRDLPGELDTLMAADRKLRDQPWFPIQPGDVVCWSIAMPDGGRHGETLVAVEDEDWPTEGGAPLRKVSETPYETIGAGASDEDQADEPDDLDDDADEPAEPVDPRVCEFQDFYDVWFEAGPSRIAVIRHGQLVHGRFVRGTL